MMKTMVKKMTLALALTVITAAPAFSLDTFEGTIQGANCVVNHLNCATDANDPHIDMERDFVLVTANGDYFFMPNLRRSLKKESYKKQVRVVGTQKGAAILVKKLEVDKDNRYSCVWSWASQQEEMSR